MSLEELRRKRLRWVEANRENDFEEGIGRLLTDLYPDNAHFIYELLQNAEDAKATEVRFILKEDGVEFEHNGSRLFTLEDVTSITSIGVSTKKDDPTNIGKFGVGFKAVFAYTSTPKIASGQYHFCIRDLVVPEGLSPCDPGEKATRFSFPFDNPQKPPEKARTEIEKNLRQLDESTLLFLNNIRKIEYLLPNSTRGFLERKETDRNQIEILVQHPEDSEPTSIFFLRFEKTVDVNDEKGNPQSCRIAVAFGLEETKEAKKQIKPLKDQVCIYFPAEKETSNLRFYLHAPFASTVARDSVRDCAANSELRDYLADLIAESMTAIRDQGLLTVNFLATLPNNRDNLSPFYKPILDRLVQAFQNERLTPMKKGGHTPAQGRFRGPARLSDLIIDNDLAGLLDGEYSPPLWVANPPQRNQREDNFLSSLSIPEWREEDLISALSSTPSVSLAAWLKSKPDTWHMELYVLLGGFLSDASQRQSNATTTRRNRLSNLPIVRLSDRTYSKGNACFFPDEDVTCDKTFPRVAKGVYSSGKNETQQKKARDFLEEIGVREVGEAEQIEAILKQRYSEGSMRPRERDMERFIAFVEKEPKQADLFSEHYIFELEDGKWGQPRIVFLDSPYLDTKLSAYYESLSDDDSERKWALSPKYRDSGIEPQRLGGFAKKLGAQTKLEPQEQYIPYEHPERNQLVSGGRRISSIKYTVNEDYDIQEFDLLFEKSELKKSELIWRVMNELPEDALRASYRPNRRGLLKTVYSSLVWNLRAHGWVPQEQGIEGNLLFVKPSEAVRDLLPSGFPFDNGAKWLKAVEFGKAKRDREEEERQKKEQATQEYQWKSGAAQEVGFSSLEEAQEAKEVLELKREDPEGFKKWEESRKPKPAFPEKSSRNPERRQKNLPNNTPTLRKKNTRREKEAFGSYGEQLILTLGLKTSTQTTTPIRWSARFVKRRCLSESVMVNTTLRPWKLSRKNTSTKSTKLNFSLCVQSARRGTRNS